MAGLLGDAMSRAAPLKQKKAAAGERPAVEQRVEKIAPQGQHSLHSGGSRSGTASNPATRQTHSDKLAGSRILPLRIQQQCFPS